VRHPVLLLCALLLTAQAPPPATPSSTPSSTPLATPIPEAAPAPAADPAPAPTPEQPAPAPTPTPPIPPPAEQQLIYHGEASSILGRNVRDRDEGLIGRIVDVLVDDTGQPRAAVIDIGGFMGMGSRKVAVAWRTLRFQTAAGRAGRIVLDMTLDQIKDVPEFRRSVNPADPPITVAVPPPPKP